jgi:uncharacterized OB-fold protein
MRQVPKSSFAQPCLVHSGFAVDLPKAPGMVRFDTAFTLISGRANAHPHENAAGMRVEVVIEKYSDEVTLPNFRPRNSP